MIRTWVCRRCNCELQFEITVNDDAAKASGDPKAFAEAEVRAVEAISRVEHQSTCKTASTAK